VPGGIRDEGTLRRLYPRMNDEAVAAYVQNFIAGAFERHLAECVVRARCIFSCLAVFSSVCFLSLNLVCACCWRDVGGQPARTPQVPAAASVAGKAQLLAAAVVVAAVALGHGNEHRKCPLQHHLLRPAPRQLRLPLHRHWRGYPAQGAAIA
jgi:hypothetical protein